MAEWMRLINIFNIWSFHYGPKPAINNQLHNLLQFSSHLPSLTFYGPPLRALRSAAIHVFQV